MADAQKERAEQAEKAQQLEEGRAAEAERVQRLEAERAEQAEKRAKEQKESANKLRRRAFVAAGAAGVAVILLVVSVFLWRKSESASAKAEEQARIAAIQRNAAEEQARRAEEQTRIAESRRLAAESSSALTKYPQRSLLLAVEAVKVGESLHGIRVAAAEQSLREALGFIGGRLVGRADGAITTVAISLDNHWLVTGSNDHTARLWDLSAKDPAANPVILRGHEGPVSAVAISPDNRWLVTGSWDKTARLWLLQMNDLVDLARSSVGRNFFADEWQLYFPGEKYHKTFPDLPGPD